MANDWRNGLRTLLTQFEAQAVRSSGLNHLFVEVADDERKKMLGPAWFSPGANKLQIVDGKPKYGKWDCSAFSGLPNISPGFREARSDEIFDEKDNGRLVRDGSNTARAVFVPMKLRSGYFCGKPSEEVGSFKSLANAAALIMAGSEDLHEHVFASDLTDVFRKPRGEVRYVFGEVPHVPNQFIAQGWSAGVLRFPDGVLIDVPISESPPDADSWVFLLYRLAWRRVAGSALRADRYAWNENVEVELGSLEGDLSLFPEAFAKNFANISKESFYSVLGTKDAPLDLNLASVFAIQLLLADLTTETVFSLGGVDKRVDYSKEQWNTAELPRVRTLRPDESEASVQPQIGILVATEVERTAVLKRLRPSKGKRAVLQVYVDKNTCFLGRLGVTEVVLCMTAMGSSGRDASTLVTAELIRFWKLPGVIMVGIAFGRDPVKQEIGNVLISERIIAYEPQRVGQTSIENRGAEHCARPLLLNRFRNVVRWSFRAPSGRECGLQIGPILSGEKLVDSFEFKKDLFRRHPTAIGGEMEGAGVAASAERENCEWVVVKSICDWGDGKKAKEHQGFAAAAAVALVEHVLNQLGSLDSLKRREF